MMFIGMAIAKLWDTEWERYSKEADLYKYLRDQRDFDHMDEYICEEVLLLTEEEQEALQFLFADCLRRECISVRLFSRLESSLPYLLSIPKSQA